MSTLRTALQRSAASTPPPIPALRLQRKCACEGSGDACTDCEQKKLHRHAEDRSSVASVPPIVGDVLHSPGQPLDANTREFMESRFGGHDFSRVRIHNDPWAGESATAVHALAYTVGDHVVFRPDHYAPSTENGRRLLAHELTHVVQQQNAAPSLSQFAEMRVSSSDDPSEREADAVADQVMRDGAVHSPQLASGAELHRVPDGGGSFGDPLPYVEATELAKCMKIMGPESTEYCREQVLGEKPEAKCPKTYTIPDDVYKAIGEAWDKSGHGGDTVTEHGGRIVTDKDGKRVIRTGSGGGGSISLPAEKPGDYTSGTFHTHPYSKTEGSFLGSSFSGGDIQNFVAGNQGSVKYVGAGSCINVLDTLNYTLRDSCKTKDLKKRHADAFAKHTGTFQEKDDAGAKAAIVGCGLCYYRACRPDDKSPIPKDATLQ